jgi:hypothetical protein
VGTLSGDRQRSEHVTDGNFFYQRLIFEIQSARL